MGAFAVVGKQRLDQELAQHPELQHLETKSEGHQVAIILDQSDLEDVLNFLKGLRDG